MLTSWICLKKKTFTAAATYAYRAMLRFNISLIYIVSCDRLYLCTFFSLIQLGHRFSVPRQNYSHLTPIINLSDCSISLGLPPLFNKYHIINHLIQKKKLSFLFQVIFLSAKSQRAWDWQLHRSPSSLPRMLSRELQTKCCVFSSSMRRSLILLLLLLVFFLSKTIQSSSEP